MNPRTLCRIICRVEVLAALVAALGIAFPINCASSQAWPAALADHSLPGSGVAAFYVPRAAGGPEIVMSPYACYGYRTGTWPAFARVLAHELRHSQQDAQGLPLDETDADAWAEANWQTLGPYVAPVLVKASKPPLKPKPRKPVKKKR